MTQPESPSLELTSVHDALQNASLATEMAQPMKNFSVRLPTSVKEKAQQICERHATDLGTFLRECTIGLVRDYGQE